MLVACCLVAGVALGQASEAPTAGPAKRLLTIADHVKVRAKPTVDGTLRGYLFKNMVVDVLDRRPDQETIGGQLGYWYRVSRGAIEGWSFGSFFSTTVPENVSDTYDLPHLDRWWGTRFGWSTDEFKNGLLPEKKVKNLDMDDYRGLIQMAKSGNYSYGPYAWAELKRSLLPFLSKHKDDQKWDYFRSRVWDPAFLAAMALQYGENDVTALVPERVAADPTFVRALCSRAPNQRSCPATGKE